MTRRRWMADEFNDERAWLIGGNAAHLARVLRARVGQEFDLVCGDRLRRGRLPLSATRASSLRWARCLIQRRVHWGPLAQASAHWCC